MAVVRSDVEWSDDEGRHKCFDFIGKSGLQLDLSRNISAFETFILFFDEEIQHKQFSVLEHLNTIV